VEVKYFLNSERALSFDEARIRSGLGRGLILEVVVEREGFFDGAKSQVCSLRDFWVSLVSLELLGSSFLILDYFLLACKPRILFNEVLQVNLGQLAHGF